VAVVVIYLHEKPVEENSKRYEYNEKNIQYHLCNPKLTPCKQSLHRSSRTYSLKT